jgi:hypothetical protein
MIALIHNKNIGKNVKRKNFSEGYKKYIVLGYSDIYGYKLFEPITETRINVTKQKFEKQFNILK